MKHYKIDYKIDNIEQKFKHRQPGRGKRSTTVKSLAKKAGEDAKNKESNYRIILKSYGKQAAQIYSKERKRVEGGLKKESAIRKLENILSDDFEMDSIRLSRHCIQRFYERPFKKNRVRIKTIIKHKRRMEKKIISYIKNNATEQQINDYKSLSSLDRSFFCKYNNKLFIPFKDNWLIIVAFNPVTFVSIWPKEWKDNQERLKRLEFKMIRSKNMGVS